MSYRQLLKEQCSYKPVNIQVNTSSNTRSNTFNSQSKQEPIENLKLTLQQATSEILRKILARADCLNLLRQIIDIKAKKVKGKTYDFKVIVQIVEKEQQRVQ